MLSFQTTIEEINELSSALGDRISVKGCFYYQLSEHPVLDCLFLGFCFVPADTFV